MEYVPRTVSSSDPPGLLSLREYEKLPYSRLNETGVRRLEQVTEDLGVPLFRFFRTEAQAQQYVGVIEAGEYTIQILPKIYKEEEKNLGYLIFLLSYTQRQFQLLQTGTADYERLKGSFLEIWIWHFATQLRHLLRTQWKHSYVEIEERTSFLRGKLLTERELAGTERLYGRYRCRYEVFTPDHLLNQVLKFCNGLLLRQTRVASNRTVLQENDALLSEVPHRPVSVRDLDLIHLNRLNRDYEPILALCRLLLEHSTLDLRAGRITQLAFVFDMNRLFEKFVAVFLRRHMKEIKVRDERHLVDVSYQYRLGRLFDEFNMDVDLVLTDDTPRSFLVDTKYKALDPEERHMGLAQTDFYQMYAYGSAGRHHYDEVILLYPSTDMVRRTFHHNGLRLHVRQFDPQAICDPKRGRLNKRAAVTQLSQALLDNHHQD